MAEFIINFLFIYIIMFVPIVFVIDFAKTGDKDWPRKGCNE